MIEFDQRKATRELNKTTRLGIDVYYPTTRNLYRSQFQVIDCALKAMCAERSALLESPTGTGKTHAALLAALSWQRWARDPTPTRVVWVARTHDQLSHAVQEYRRSCAERPLMSLRLSRERFCLHPNILTAPNKAEACEEATKIPKNMNRAGRFDVRNSGCAHLDKAEAIGYPQSSRWRSHFRLGGKMETYSIEDAITEGNSMTVCPFHLAQDQIQEGAALIFITYQQLIDPITRRAGGLEQVIEDAVVVVDEAHNLPQVSRDAASYEISEARLQNLVDTLRDFVPHLHEHKDAQQMIQSLVAGTLPDDDTKSSYFTKAVDGGGKKRKKKGGMQFAATQYGGPLVALLSWLRTAAYGGDPSPLRALSNPTKGDDGRDERIWDGDSAALFVREVVGLVSADRVDQNCKILWKLRKTLIEEGLESGAVRSDTINDLEAILVKLRFLLDPESAKHYRLIALGPKPAKKQKSKFRGRKNKAFEDDDDDDEDTMGARLRFVCLSGSVAMQVLLRGQRTAGLGEAAYLRPARSLLLMSGTLRPFDIISNELGLEKVDDEKTMVMVKPQKQTKQKKDDRPKSYAYRTSCVSAVHLPNIKTAMLPLHLATARGVELDASYKNSTADPESEVSRRYFDALGCAIHGIVTAAPNGTLVFFKSYKLLEVVVEYWRNEGWFAKISAAKKIYIEERKLTGDQFDARLVSYRKMAETNRGAILLAVMRGRAAEGADFKNEAARVCVVVGMPYPPYFEAATRLKREHDTAILGDKAGEKWYAAEAYRNVAQAAGRLVRHKDDFGVLVLLDKALTRNDTYLPEYINHRLTSLNGATDLHHKLHDFFTTKGCPRTQQGPEDF